MMKSPMIPVVPCKFSTDTAFRLGPDGSINVVDVRYPTSPGAEHTHYTYLPLYVCALVAEREC